MMVVLAPPESDTFKEKWKEKHSKFYWVSEENKVTEDKVIGCDVWVHCSPLFRLSEEERE